MPVSDLRDWISKVERMGQIRRVTGANCEQEIGALTDLFMEKIGRPALLFEEIPGYPAGYRVLSNFATSAERIALSLEIPQGLSLLEMVRYCRRSQDIPKIKPVFVESGLVQENVETGGNINLLRFPTPRWHEQDGGRYLGTGCAVIMRDTDSEWINVGCYRVMIHDERSLGIMISAGKQGRVIMEKYWARGKACPVAISFGHDPLIHFVAGLNAAAGMCEYDIAGGIRGGPISVISGPVTGLPIPSAAEIAVEGYIAPGTTQPEGPFGEWTGYYAGGRRQEPVVKVEALMYRNNPIILGAIPRKPPSDDTYFSSFLTSAAIWQQMEDAGVQGIHGVWTHEASGSRMFVTVAINQMYPGHSKQAALSAASCYAGSYLNKFVVVVDDDINPTILDEVVWAMCTRVDPDTDLDIVRNCLSGPLDPMAYPPEQPSFNKKILIDACRPWLRKDTFPGVVEASASIKRRVRERWPEICNF